MRCNSGGGEHDYWFLEQSYSLELQRVVAHTEGAKTRAMAHKDPFPPFMGMFVGQS